MSDEVIQDISLFENFLSKLFDSHERAKKLLAICRNAIGPKDFREGLNLNFGDFSASLEAVGVERESYPELHESLLQIFVSEKAVNVSNSLRKSCADRLSNFEPVVGYATTRDSLRCLRPDPAWLTLFEKPSEEVLVQHVNTWLAEKGAPPLGCDHNLEPLTEVREHNRQVVHRFQQDAMPLVRAWCEKFEPENVNGSLSKTHSPEELRQYLDDVGVFDFSKIDDVAMMNWLRILNIWPTNMPQSLVPEELGLSSLDLSAERRKVCEAQRKAQEERKRVQRSIDFNNRSIDPNNVDILALSEELLIGLSPGVLSKALGSTSKLDVVEKSSSSRQGRRGGTAGRGGRSRMPEEKAELIGQLGEMAVYHWLRRRYHNQDIDSAWRSENSKLITGRTGDDSLGYDFEVSYRSQIWQIEVKASLGDPQAFSMGESEVRAARAAARRKSGVQYKIAYVSNISDTSKTTIEMLPNPMTETGTRLFQLLGEGIRYSFNRATS